MILTDLRVAFALLTRLPVGAPSGDFARAVWAYPVAGLAVGGIGAVANWLAAGLAPPLAAVWTVAAMILATGALHEDGLADTADGFGGGVTIERKLAIMRDSRIGSFGALALIVSLAIRGSAIAALVQPARVAPALLVSCALGRAAMIGMLIILRPARPDGLAASLASLRPVTAAAGIALALLAALVLLPWRQAALAAGFAALVSGVAAVIARRQIGGYTGDVLGAAEIAAECVVLTALCR